MIKAIQTQYKGYRFRSRLEARWAVYFDSLGIEWVYEPEGFELSNGKMYLPDFWIPIKDHQYDGAGYYVEIKPRQLNNEELENCRLLAIESGHACCMLCGQPWPGELIACKWNRNGSFYDYTNTVEEFGLLVYPSGVVSSNNQSQAWKAARSARFEHGENNG